MKAGKPQPIWLFVLFLAGSALGFLVGAYTGTEFGTGLVANNALRKDALQIEAQVDALRQLRDGDVAAAIEILETVVDDSLVVFDPRQPLPGINAETDARVARAIARVHRYRQAYPRKSDRPFVDDMLRHLFDKHGLP